MKTGWRYMSDEFDDDNLDPKWIGFIYIIQHNESGKKYIGKKLLTKAATKTVNGKKKKIRKPSDWQNYWSSSPDLQKIIEEEGQDKFTRKIVMFCESKISLNYAEESLQYRLGVLESDKWFNSNIRSRIFKKNVINFDKTYLITLENISKMYK